jgi:hypothetical protein
MGQWSIDTAGIMFYDSVSMTTTDMSQYLGFSPSSETIQQQKTEWFNLDEEALSEDNPPVSKIKIDTITEKEFVKYKNRYQSKINYDSSLVVWTDTSFTIKCDSSVHTFNTRVTDDFPYCYYKGLLQPLNLYIVWSIDGRNEIGSLLLIDKKTGKVFVFDSGFDEPLTTLFISPGNKYLMSFANTWYESDHCYIPILKINPAKNKFTLNYFYSFCIDKVNIDDMIWVSDNSFALLVTEKENQKNADSIKHKNYLKASFVKPVQSASH